MKHILKKIHNMENFDLKGFAKGKKQQKEQIGGNAIIYTRVSSSEQVDGQSLEMQRVCQNTFIHCRW